LSEEKRRKKIEELQKRIEEFHKRHTPAFCRKCAKQWTPVCILLYSLHAVTGVECFEPKER